MSNKKLSGIAFNFGKQQNGYYTSVSGKKLILDNLKAILLTVPGERIQLPEFGVGLKRFVFDPNDPSLEQILKSAIIEQVTLWEPGVDIQDIQFRRDEDNTLNIRLVVQLNELSGEVATLDLSLS